MLTIGVSSGFDGFQLDDSVYTVCWLQHMRGQMTARGPSRPTLDGQYRITAIMGRQCLRPLGVRGIFMVDDADGTIRRQRLMLDPRSSCRRRAACTVTRHWHAQSVSGLLRRQRCPCHDLVISHAGRTLSDHSCRLGEGACRKCAGFRTTAPVRAAASVQGRHPKPCTVVPKL